MYRLSSSIIFQPLVKLSKQFGPHMPSSHSLRFSSIFVISILHDVYWVSQPLLSLSMLALSSKRYQAYICLFASLILFIALWVFFPAHCVGLIRYSFLCSGWIFSALSLVPSCSQFTTAYSTFVFLALWITSLSQSSSFSPQSTSSIYWVLLTQPSSFPQVLVFLFQFSFARQVSIVVQRPTPPLCSIQFAFSCQWVVSLFRFGIHSFGIWSRRVLSRRWQL